MTQGDGTNTNDQLREALIRINALEERLGEADRDVFYWKNECKRIANELAMTKQDLADTRDLYDLWRAKANDYFGG